MEGVQRKLDKLDKLENDLNDLKLEPVKITGGPWIHLPQVIVDIILVYVGDIDTCALLKLTSKTVFQPSEVVYQFLCYYIYLQQTIKQTCQLNHRFPTWYTMILHRPRVRTNGFYTLRTTYTKTYNNDAFWEEKQYNSIETHYYRHLRFYNNGRVLYNLDIHTPQEISKLLKIGHSNSNKKLYEGKYYLKKNYLWIEIPLPYCIIVFECLLLHSSNDLYNSKHPEYAYYITEEEKKQYCGYFNVLKLIAHYSRPINSIGIMYHQGGDPIPFHQQQNQLPQQGNVVHGQEHNQDGEDEQQQQPPIATVSYPIPPHNYFYFHRRLDFFS